MGFPGGSEGKESACNVGDLGSVPGSGRSPGKEMAAHSSILVAVHHEHGGAVALQGDAVLTAQAARVHGAAIAAPGSGAEELPADASQQGKETEMEEKQKGPVVEDGGKVQAAADPPESELVREIRHSLGLGDEAEEHVLLLAFKTMMEKAAEADRLREELEKVRAEAAALREKEEERKKKDLLDQGVREGKITPATRPW